MALMGGALLPPVLVARLESDSLATLGIGIISVGCCMVTCGITAVLFGFLQRRGSTMPSGVRTAVTANIFILAFFALELSDRLVRREGRIVYWSTFLLLPALLLFCGLLTARRWAWWTSRSTAALGVLWFLGFAVVIPFANLQTEGVPVPWYGRGYMICVSLVFASIMAGAFWSLNRPETRNYFGINKG